jgi:hypothetical protein
MEDTIQLNPTRHIPQIYRRAFERHLLFYHISDDKQDEDTELNHDHEEKTFEEIIHELNTLSLDQQDLLDLIVRTISNISLHLNGSRKLVSKLIELREQRYYNASKSSKGVILK